MAVFCFLSIILLVAVTCKATAGKFVKARGSRFFVNDEPFFFAGANCYDLFTYGSGSGDTETSYMNKSAIDSHMSTMARNGVTVLRTWAFNTSPQWHTFEASKGDYNEQQFQEFDYIMFSAANHGIRVIATLENYWGDYGGIPQRLVWENLNTTNPNQGNFFTSESATNSYLEFVRHFLTRTNHYSNLSYVNDPTLFAWEVMNEPRYQGFGDDVTSQILRTWIDRVGAFVKSVDSNHMLSSGLEGHGSRYGFAGDEGNDFLVIHASPYIDFCSAHPYPTEPWANLTIPETVSLLKAWTFDCQETLGKPMVIGEFNVDETHGARSEWWSAIFDTIESEDVAGDCFWWFESSQGNHDSTYGVREGAPELTVFQLHAKKMLSKCQ